jgi:hypothetical protein
MNLTNIDRDSFWVPSLYFSEKLGFSTSANQMVTTGVVNQGFAGCESDSTAIATASFTAVGVLMQQPVDDYTPYRIKARCQAGKDSYVLIGYAPASPTGDDAWTQGNYFAFDGEFDDIVNINPEGVGDTYYGRALMIGVAMASENGNVVRARLSVQDLGVSPGPFAKAVS